MLAAPVPPQPHQFAPPMASAYATRRPTPRVDINGRGPSLSLSVGTGRLTAPRLEMPNRASTLPLSIAMPSAVPPSPAPRPATQTKPTAASGVYASEIIPRLYISDLAAAENPALLRALRITHVVSAMRGNVQLPYGAAPGPPIQQLHLPLDDTPFAELAAHLPQATRFVCDALNQDPEARVLVHCAQGISRSASVTAAVLVRLYNWHPDRAVAYVQKRRPGAEPNFGFRSQLREYADGLGINLV